MRELFSETHRLILLVADLPLEIWNEPGSWDGWFALIGVTDSFT
jgi:hypothetical protein